MQYSRFQGSFRQSMFAAAVLLLGAGPLALGCGTKENAATGTETPVKEAAPASPEKAEAPSAAAADKGTAAEHGALKAEPAAAAAYQGGSDVKANPSKPGAAAEAAAPSTAAAPLAEGAAAPTEPTVTSPKIGEANFTVWMQAVPKLKAGQQGVVEVVLVPKEPFHTNENYPYKIKMSDPPAGVSFPQAIVRKEGMSLSPQRGVMRVPFVASAPGDARIAGKFSFSVCSSDQCLIDSRDLAITVKVE